MRRFSPLSFVLPAFLISFTASADTAVPEGFTALIHSADLNNWQNPANAAEHWKIENGELSNDGKGEDLVTDRAYQDFELRLEWKIPLRGDSGIYLPGGQQVQIWAKDSGSGGFVFNHRYTVSPSVVADKPLGEWNAFIIILKNSKVTVSLNGKTVMQDVPVEKGFDPPLLGPVSGSIRLQKSPHNVASTFRNIFIRAL